MFFIPFYMITSCSPSICLVSDMSLQKNMHSLLICIKNIYIWSTASLRHILLLTPIALYVDFTSKEVEYGAMFVGEVCISIAMACQLIRNNIQTSFKITAVNL